MNHWQKARFNSCQTYAFYLINKAIKYKVIMNQLLKEVLCEVDKLDIKDYKADQICLNIIVILRCEAESFISKFIFILNTQSFSNTKFSPKYNEIVFF